MLKQNAEYKRFVLELSNLIKKETDKFVFVCIGTNRVIGDSVGPIVGSILKRNVKLNNKIKVLGDCKNNICYKDINKKVQIINKLYPENSLIIIDSALSSKENIGKIFVENKGLKYGEGLKKSNKTIGDISIKAVTGINFNNRFKNFQNLKNAAYSDVTNLAQFISEGIIQVIESKVV